MTEGQLAEIEERANRPPTSQYYLVVPREDAQALIAEVRRLQAKLRADGPWYGLHS